MEGQGGASGTAPIDRGRRLLALLLQILPLLGLSGCTAIWTFIPVNSFIRYSSQPEFWTFAIIAGICSLVAACWGFGYHYLARRERLGCAMTLLGPLFVIWSFGYLFEGFALGNSDLDEARRRQAIIWTGILSAIPVTFMAWDAWRLARPRRPPDRSV